MSCKCYTSISYMAVHVTRLPDQRLIVDRHNPSGIFIEKYIFDKDNKRMLEHNDKVLFSDFLNAISASPYHPWKVIATFPREDNSQDVLFAQEIRY